MFFDLHFSMMPYHSFILICCLLLPLGQTRAADEDRLKFYYNIAEGNYMIGDLSGAERGIEQSLRLDPGHARSLALKAKVRLDQSKPEAALLAAEKAIEAAPKTLEYQVLRALILGNLNRRAEAIQQIDTVLKIAEPSSQDALTAQQLKGLLNLADERWDEAAAAFKKIYEAQPEASQTGILDLQKIVGQNPDNLEATVTLASIYADLENWTALEDLIEPIGKNPLLADVALYLEGRVALSRDRVGTARAKFEEALKLNQDRPSSLQHTLEFYRSICFDRLERFEEAKNSLKLAIDGGYVPETPSEAVHLGRLLMREKDVDTLIPILEKALLRGNASAEGWAILGRAHLIKEQNALAISALNQSLQLKPDQADMLALRGSLLRKIGDLEGALVDYKRAHFLVPSSPVLSYEQGLVLLQLGRIDEAEPMLETAARKLTTHPTLDLLHASCAYTLGEYDKAAQSLSEYLKPELSGNALEKFQANLSDTAAFLNTLLTQRHNMKLPELSSKSQAARLFAQYCAGEATRKEVLDWAGRAETPELARKQIGSTAYWLAQVETHRGNDKKVKELLKITLEAGSPENPEWQFARWQLANTKN